MRSITTATVAVLLWLAIALAIDRWLLAPFCAGCVDVLALDVKVRLPAAELAYPPVSVLVLIVVPMFALALYLVPWKKWRVGSAWRASFARWAQPWFWLLIVMILAVIGESLYLAVKDFLPTALSAVAEKFSVSVSFSVFKDYQPLSLTTSLAGFIGLGLGVYLFLTRGVAELLEWPGA